MNKNAVERKIQSTPFVRINFFFFLQAQHFNLNSVPKPRKLIMVGIHIFFSLKNGPGDNETIISGYCSQYKMATCVGLKHSIWAFSV